MFQTLVGVGVGAAVGAGAVYTVLQRKHKPPEPPVVHPITKHPAARHGLPLKDRIREFHGYIACFDPSTRNPAWVIEHMNKDSASGSAERGNDFKEDKAIPHRFRSKLSDYHKSGFDRGHMTPCMDHKGSQVEMDDTFYLTNMSPQVGEGFNRDYWARFEKFTKDVLKRADDVYVVTGPVFAPTFTPNGLRASHGFIGNAPQPVAVPTHYFKVILAEKRDARGQPAYAVGAFAMPNRRIDSEAPLLSFAVPLEFLEGVTGVEFFPGLLADKQRAALEAPAADWRKLGSAQWQALKAAGAPLLPESITGITDAVVPASGLPPFAELEKVTCTSGPKQFRPRPTGAAGDGVVHLCENVRCSLPQERFWEAKGQKAAGRSS